MSDGIKYTNWDGIDLRWSPSRILCSIWVTLKSAFRWPANNFIFVKLFCPASHFFCLELKTVIRLSQSYLQSYQFIYWLQLVGLSSQNLASDPVHQRLASSGSGLGIFDFADQPLNISRPPLLPSFFTTPIISESFTFLRALAAAFQFHDSSSPSRYFLRSNTLLNGRPSKPLEPTSLSVKIEATQLNRNSAQGRCDLFLTPAFLGSWVFKYNAPQLSDLRRIQQASRLATESHSQSSTATLGCDNKTCTAPQLNFLRAPEQDLNATNLEHLPRLSTPSRSRRATRPPPPFFHSDYNQYIEEEVPFCLLHSSRFQSALCLSQIINTSRMSRRFPAEEWNRDYWLNVSIRWLPLVEYPRQAFQWVSHRGQHVSHTSTRLRDVAFSAIRDWSSGQDRAEGNVVAYSMHL
ncbi:hypothetical protein C8R44DRAFT_750877 [Mycena epipterygia]|nr:hypothetical protein C8R44DRAFT_750877 [Mycena epipterygia]